MMDNVERAIDYHFNERAYLRLALTAAGACQDNHNGNRFLARLGQTAVQLVIANLCYENAASQKGTDEMQKFIDNKDQLASAAKGAGIADCIQLCQWSGPPSRGVLSRATQAMFGAAWKDSNKSLDVVERIARRLIPSLDTHLPSVSGAISHTQTSERLLGSFPQPEPQVADVFGPIAMGNIAFFSGLDTIPTSLNTLTAIDTVNNTALPSVGNEPAECSFSSDVQSATNFCDILLRQGTEQTASDATIPLPDTNWAVRPPSLMATAYHTGGYSATLPISLSEQATNTRQRKRKRVKSGTGSGEWLQTFMTGEKYRCAEHQMPDPCTNFLAQVRLKEIEKLTVSHSNELLKLWVGIGSAHSIVALRETLKTLRQEDNLHLQSPLKRLSSTERFSTIEKIEGQMTSLRLLKRCHVLRLWEDHCDNSDSQFSYEWVASASQGRKRPGNPRNADRCQSTMALLEKLCPGSGELSHEENKSMVAKVKSLQRLGQRLSMLTNRYGQGVLGLIQCFGIQSTTEAFPDISDRTLLIPSNAEFERFLFVLDREQGEWIRWLSTAVDPMVERVLYGTVRETSPFPIEFVEPSYVLKLPKGSGALISLISQDVRGN